MTAQTRSSGPPTGRAIAAPLRILRRPIKPISVRFFLRPSRSKEVGSVVCRIRCNGEDAGDFVITDQRGFSLQFTLPRGGPSTPTQPSDWNKAKQRPVDSTHPAWLVLAQAEADIRGVYQRQAENARLRQTPVPTVRSVKWAYLNGSDPYILGPQWAYEKPVRPFLDANTPLTVALADYIDNLPADLSPVTRSRHQRTLRYLTEYVAGGDSPTVSNVRIPWAKGFHRAMINRPPDSKGRKPSVDEATRHIGRIADMLQHLFQGEVIERNPLAGVKWPRAKIKPVYYLDTHDMAALDALTHLSAVRVHARWWFRFMAYSGLDYPNAQRLLANPSAFIEHGRAGAKIVMSRNKSAQEFDVPIWTELAQMLTEPVPPVLHPKTLNECLKSLGQEIGFAYPITVKTARKSAGAYFLTMGYKIEEVSRILGHRDVTTTQRYYVRVLGSMVDRGTLRLSGGTALTLTT